MAELSQRAKEAEDHIAAARNETHEQLEARVAKVKATAQRRRQETKARGAKAKDELAAAWASLQAHPQEAEAVDHLAIIWVMSLGVMIPARCPSLNTSARRSPLSAPIREPAARPGARRWSGPARRAGVRPTP
jgi:hypothetical protein